MSFKNKDFPIIVCLELKDGSVAPLAWSDIEISKKSLRRETHKFMKDTDMVGLPLCLSQTSMIHKMK